MKGIEYYAKSKTATLPEAHLDTARTRRSEGAQPLGVS
jgi:hypothetical protein